MEYEFSVSKTTEIIVIFLKLLVTNTSDTKNGTQQMSNKFIIESGT